MIFAKVDVELRDHDKGHRAGAAMATWLWALLWTRAKEEDGFVARASLRGSWRGERQAVADMRKLVEVGLAVESVKTSDGLREDFAWTSLGLRPDFVEGWSIVGYSEKNELKVTIAARRQAEVERQERFRSKKTSVSRRDSAVGHASPPSQDQRVTNGPVTLPESESESESESDLRDQRILSEFQTPTTPTHTEGGGQNPEIAQDAPGTPTEAPIDPAPVSEVKASQEPSQAPPSASLTLSGVDASPRVPADVQAVFDHWVAERGKVVTGRGPKPKLDDKRRKFIASRLKTWPAPELCLAIDGACNTPWNRGDEGGKVFLDLELILRDAAHIERYGLAAPAKAVPRPRPDEPVSAKPAATDEELAAFFADNAAEPFAPGSDMYDDEAEEAS